MLNCIAHDISKIPKTDPSRAENAILDLQIDDIVEVAEKYLQSEFTQFAPFVTWARVCALYALYY